MYVDDLDDGFFYVTFFAFVVKTRIVSHFYWGFGVYIGVYLSLVVRKPVFGVSDQVPHKPGRAATEDG